MSHEREYPQPSQDYTHRRAWNARRIKALRAYLKLTQSEMAEELQVRQQTISEWETGVHTPHRSTQKVLSMVAERAGFAYQVEPQQPDNPTDPSQT
jgi:DNA-binding transcriptional regulator YiaG